MMTNIQLLKKMETGTLPITLQDGSTQMLEVRKYFGPDVATRSDTNGGQFAPVDLFQPMSSIPGTVAPLMAPSVRFFPRTNPMVMQSDPIRTYVANSRIAVFTGSTAPGIMIRDAPVFQEDNDFFIF